MVANSNDITDDGDPPVGPRARGCFAVSLANRLRKVKHKLLQCRRPNEAGDKISNIDEGCSGLATVTLSLSQATAARPQRGISPQATDQLQIPATRPGQVAADGRTSGAVRSPAAESQGRDGAPPHQHQPSHHQQSVLPEDPADEGLFAGAARCPAPVALLVLGVAPGTRLAGLPVPSGVSASGASPSAADDVVVHQPDRCLPGGLQPHLQPHSQPPGAAAQFGRRSTSGPLRLPSAAGHSQPSLAASAAAAVAASGGSQQPHTSCPFSCVWVNCSAQEQLLLEAASEYDTIFAHMYGRDPALRAMLKELARHMLAEAALPPAVTHLVPGGAATAPPGVPARSWPLAGGMRTATGDGAGGAISELLGQHQHQHAGQRHPYHQQQRHSDSAYGPGGLGGISTGGEGLRYGSIASDASSSASSSRDAGAGAGAGCGAGRGGLQLQQQAFTVLRLTPCRVRVPASAPPTGCQGATYSSAVASAPTSRIPSNAALPYPNNPNSAAAVHTGDTSPVPLTRAPSLPAARLEVGPGPVGGRTVELPALMVEHIGADGGDAAGAAAPEVYDRLQRDCSILSSVAAIITLFDLYGRVLHQNALSVDYMGYHRPQQVQRRHGGGGGGGGGGGMTGRSPLECLFELDPGKLPEMLSDVMEGRAWTGIVRVPPRLWDELDEMDEMHAAQHQHQQQHQSHQGRLKGQHAALLTTVSWPRHHVGEGGSGDDGGSTSTAVAAEEADGREAEALTDSAVRQIVSAAATVPSAGPRPQSRGDSGGAASVATTTAAAAEATGGKEVGAPGGSGWRGGHALPAAAVKATASSAVRAVARLVQGLRTGSGGGVSALSLAPRRQSSSGLDSSAASTEGVTIRSEGGLAIRSGVTRGSGAGGPDPVSDLASSGGGGGSSAPRPLSFSAGANGLRLRRSGADPGAGGGATSSSGPSRWFFPQQRSRLGGGGGGGGGGAGVSAGDHPHAHDLRGGSPYVSEARSDETPLTTSRGPGRLASPPDIKVRPHEPTAVAAAASAAVSGGAVDEGLTVHRSFASMAALSASPFAHLTDLGPGGGSGGGVVQRAESMTAARPRAGPGGGGGGGDGGGGGGGGGTATQRARGVVAHTACSGPLPMLYGSGGERAGPRRTPQRTRSGNVVLDLQAMTTSTWSLVGAWPSGCGVTRTSAAAARRRASISSVPLHPPQHHHSPAAGHHPQQSLLPHELRSPTSPFSAAAATMPPAAAAAAAAAVRVPTSLALAMRSDQSALAASRQKRQQQLEGGQSAKGSGRRASISGGTQLPRVVFFAAASVQRVSARHQRQLQQLQQQHRRSNPNSFPPSVSSSTETGAAAAAVSHRYPHPRQGARRGSALPTLGPMGKSVSMPHSSGRCRQSFQQMDAAAAGAVARRRLTANSPLSITQVGHQCQGGGISPVAASSPSPGGQRGGGADALMATSASDGGSSLAASYTEVVTAAVDVFCGEGVGGGGSGGGGGGGGGGGAAAGAAAAALGSAAASPRGFVTGPSSGPSDTPKVGEADAGAAAGALGAPGGSRGVATVGGVVADSKDPGLSRSLRREGGSSGVASGAQPVAASLDAHQVSVSWTGGGDGPAAVEAVEAVEEEDDEDAGVLEAEGDDVFMVGDDAAGVEAGQGGGEETDGEKGDDDDEEEEDEEEEEEEEGARWHEVSARPFRDPVSRRRCILLMQMDVTARVETERQLAELMDAEHKILEQIFPRHVLEHMALDAARPQCAFHMFRRDVSSLATKHDAVSILFADIKGFTNMCKEVEPEAVMTFLNELYNRFDTLLDVYGVYKVETIGDCYMVAGGLIRKDEEGFASVHGPGAVDPLHAVRVMSFAKAMLREAGTMLLPNTGETLKIRVGIHSGPVVSGVVGTRMPRFCLFGDTVNTASRMESTAEPGTIHVSEDCRQLLTKETWQPTGGVEVKGKGLMHTFVWLGNESETAPHLLPEGTALHGWEAVGGLAGQQPKRSCTTPRREMPLVRGSGAAGAGAAAGGSNGASAPLRLGSVALRPKRSITNPRETAVVVRRGAEIWARDLARLNIGQPSSNSQCSTATTTATIAPAATSSAAVAGSAASQRQLPSQSSTPSLSKGVNSPTC